MTVPDSAERRQAAALADLAELTAFVAEAQRRLGWAVFRARGLGCPWKAIAGALSVSVNTARKRYP